MGNAEILATGLEFGGKGSAILLDDDATINIAGGAKAENVFDAMIASGSIKPLHNEDRTIVVTTNSGNVMISVVSPTVTEAPAPTAAPNNNNVSTPTAAPTNDNIGIETESPTLAPTTASPTKSPTKAPTSSSCTDTTASFKVQGVKKAKTCANIATRATLCDKELKNTTPGTFVKTICPVACNNCPSDNDDAPPKCEDTTSKIKWVDNKGKIKKTSCKTNKKCNKKDVDGNFVWQSCPVKCKKCDKLQELLEEEEKQNEGNGGNNNDNNNVFCKDSTKFLYKNKKGKDCAWVKEMGDKCNISWRNKKLSEYCPKACGVC